MTGRPSPLPIKRWLMVRQYPQRRLPRVRPFSHSAPAIKLGREKHAFRIGIKQHLLRIKAVEIRRSFARYRIPVIACFAKFPDRDAAVPDASRLMQQEIESISE